MPGPSPSSSRSIRSRTSPWTAAAASRGDKLARFPLGPNQPHKEQRRRRGLHLPKALIKETCAMIRCYPIPVPAQARGLRHLLSRCGYDYGFVRRLIQIQQAGMHIQTNDAPMRMLEEMEARNERFTLKELALSGNDLNMIGIRGKAAGDTLKLLLDHVLDHPEDNDKEHSCGWLSSTSADLMNSLATTERFSDFGELFSCAHCKACGRISFSL